MRGKDFDAQIGRREEGITPAHAGKSSDYQKYMAAAGDHPRACGEKPGMESITISKKGSPPRMRGKAGENYQLPELDRITPAHAGKRNSQA